MRSNVFAFLIFLSGGDELQFSGKLITWAWILFSRLGLYLIVKLNISVLLLAEDGSYRVETFGDTVWMLQRC